MFLKATCIEWIFILSDQRERQRNLGKYVLNRILTKPFS